MNRALLRGVLASCTALLCIATHADPGSLGYQQATGHKAMAMVPGVPGTRSMAIEQSHDVAAAATAQARCNAKRARNGPPCELIWINDEPIATGAEIKASLPKPPYPLYLWRYTSGSATVYLAGTIHVLKPSLYPLPDPLEQAFAAAQRVVVEVNVKAYSPLAIQKATMTRALLPSGQSLQGLLSEQNYAKTAQALLQHGIDIDQLARGKPAIVMQQLLLARLSAMGYPLTSGVEQHFLARVGDKEVLELETLDAQMALLFEQPLDLQRQLLIDAVNQTADVDVLLTDMIAAWLSGDDKKLLALFERQAGESAEARAFNEQLLDQRNKSMTEKIKSYLSGNGTYLVLIGAAHYVGDEGIIALLQKAGITGQRILSNARL